MFGFLKDKLKSVVDRFTKKVEEEGIEEVIEVKEIKKDNKKTEKSNIKSKAGKEQKWHKEKAEKSKKKTEREEGIEASKEEIKNIKPAIEEEREKKIAEVEKSEYKADAQIEKRGGEEENKTGFFGRIFGKKRKEDEFEKVEKADKNEAEAVKEEIKIIEDKIEKDEDNEKEEEIVETKKGLFSFISEKVTTKKISEKQFEGMFWELEIAMLESNVAVEVIDKIKNDLKEKLVDNPIKRSEIDSIIKESLKESIYGLFKIPEVNLLERIKEKKPFIICFIGVNGSGKTTTIAKVANYLQKNKLSCVLAAADTFRAAAIQQLEEHANNLGVKLIKHDYGADSAAVAFDAIKHAEARHIDVVLIDTAGRLHSNDDLMKEMQKLIRVANPDLKIFVGESITGNDCVEQAKKFNEMIGIDGIILAKADVDDKGGAAISVSYITQKPILFLGTGQTYNDLKEFNKDELIKTLGL